MKRLVCPVSLAVLIVISCSRPRNLESLPEGQLEIIWTVQPSESPDEEPWFGRIGDIEVWGKYVYVLDSNRRSIIMIDDNGSLVKEIGQAGSGPGEFGRGPLDMSISSSGDIYAQRSNDSPGDFNKYTAEGEFQEVIHHAQLYAGTLMFPIELAAVSGNTLFYQCIPRGMDRLTPQEQREAPLFAFVSSNEVTHLVNRWISEEAEIVRKDLQKQEERPLIDEFSRGFACLGLKEGELIFIKWHDPYTVHRIVSDGTRSDFSYVDIARNPVAIPFQEQPESGIRYRSGGILTGWQRGTRMWLFTWTHWVRGIARNDTNLFVFVEELGEENWEQRIYVIDIQKERATMTIPVDIHPGTVPGTVLEGVLNDGTLIFSVSEPYPGLAAYRIVEPN